MRFSISILCFLLLNSGQAQTLGGRAVYSFLHLPLSTQLSAAGGVNVSLRSNEAGIAIFNPALLSSEHSMQGLINFNALPGGVKAYSLSGISNPIEGRVFSASIFYVDYGENLQTDASGMELGRFRPTDFVAQVQASGTYLHRWNYGLGFKYIHSSYGPYRSSGLALDAGLNYLDTARGFSAGLLIRNMGVQLTSFAGENEDLPFDMTAGLTKRLANAPFAFSVTADQLHHFDLLYDNPNEESSGSRGFASKLFNHFVVAAHVYLGQHLEATLGYNALKRSELAIPEGGNGLTGFSGGIKASFPKFQVLYARSNYQRNISYNQLGITLMLKRFFGAATL